MVTGRLFGSKSKGKAMIDPEYTAKRMLCLYKHSNYTPKARATDHAFAYDSKDDNRKFWIAVLQMIHKLKEGTAK